MRNNKTVCSTLNGLLAIKHPTLNILVREDGSVLLHKCGSRINYGWTKGSLAKDGYRIIRIKKKNIYVHRLVAEAFFENPEGKKTVDHINRVRDDNRVQNLRWATAKEQRENSSSVIFRADYGARATENKKEYDKNYHKAHIDEIHARQRKYHQEHREEINARKRRRAHEQANH